MFTIKDVCTEVLENEVLPRLGGAHYLNVSMSCRWLQRITLKYLEKNATPWALAKSYTEASRENNLLYLSLHYKTTHDWEMIAHTAASSAHLDLLKEALSHVILIVDGV